MEGSNPGLVWPSLQGPATIPVSPPMGPMEEAHLTEGPIPSLANAVKNLMGKHAQEIRDSLDVGMTNRTQPHIAYLKTAFRSFYTKQETHVLDFFNRPIGCSPVLRQSVQIMKRFGRPDYNYNRVKVRDLFLDCDTKPFVNVLNYNLELHKHPELDEFSIWIQQTKCLLDMWRQAAVDAMNAEKTLESRIQIFQDIYKKAEQVLSLPMCDGYAELAQSIELYLQQIFKENAIEGIYGEYIEALKKLCVLTESIGSVRSLVNASTEPLCSVCITEPVSLALVPCGHTFCTNCGTRQLTTCYVCRVNVKDRLRIYLS